MSTEEMSETTTTNYNYENVNADAASISIRGDIVRSDAEPTDVVPATSNGTAEYHPEDTPKEQNGDSDSIAGQTLTLRALVSTKEAGVIIGKAGKNVAELREVTGVKAGVSKVIQGIHDRVLSVVGTLDGVAKTLLENPVSASPNSAPITPSPNAFTSVRLLISHNLMGTIIGRQGAKIKHIQDVSNARMVASKEMLPQSTERIVEVQGTVEAIKIAVWEIGKCLIEDNERGIGTVLYNPAIRITSPSYSTNRGRNDYAIRTGNGTDFTRPNRNSGTGTSGGSGSDYSGSRRSSTNFDPAQTRVQNISIPADMVGCIIGKAGSKISEIRRLSGSRISIAKTPHDETGERMFTIQGTSEANEKALYLLYHQLESEKDRRMNASNGGEAGV
ncbi:3866_t:CDS:2 [Paraglomus brasilianum]|uniref:3866_t:CDS:1 n=1 Tax=Paraglomus brasilianum TaxID=144538 RepID=A0A9N9CB06_9GLOM|nr:3866_t:CDS:2 [Paraglomus brasilianum]